jgi:hypothetical protein
MVSKLPCMGCVMRIGFSCDAVDWMATGSTAGRAEQRAEARVLARAE